MFVPLIIIDCQFISQSCTVFSFGYYKDLSVVEKDLSQVCLLDNSHMSYAMHQGRCLSDAWYETDCGVDNGIPIEGWTSDPTDTGLLDILVLLDGLRFVDDVRSVLSLRF